MPAKLDRTIIQRWGTGWRKIWLICNETVEVGPVVKSRDKASKTKRRGK